ncbi:class I SAM-dependent methyltransferase [Microvirga sp. CF3016]|uniref:class I SAM-dependent methyltransferase n=1 Tax=Microvirga sp. CF3016 TaxID=3110181 RepID=UPI002E789FAC|nr:class I SAM-dependent methyltransferase [Microvirga sp. CF3016]MEE1610171.1 class I SAM-dependent methyltransferase [Microvirga sp. CF3016]
MNIIVNLARPRTYAELGVYRGCSLLAALTAANNAKLALRAWGIDTWAGDEHSGSYVGDGFYQEVLAKTSELNSDTHLLRMTFDEAQPKIDDGTIDLLHIDGLHTYEAVKHDFENWLPKLSDAGIVILHDTAEFKDDFGVYRLWDEVRGRYPNLAFTHSHGLGVLFVGETRTPDVQRLIDAWDDDLFRGMFSTVCRYAGELNRITQGSEIVA